MPHYVAKNHFLNPEASVVALDHHCEQYQLDYEFPEKINFFFSFSQEFHKILSFNPKNNPSGKIKKKMEQPGGEE